MEEELEEELEEEEAETEVLIDRVIFRQRHISAARARAVLWLHRR